MRDNHSLSVLDLNIGALMALCRLPFHLNRLVHGFWTSIDKG